MTEILKLRAFTSGIVTDLDPINDNLTVISLYEIEEDADTGLLFYKRLDEKYIGKFVDITLKSSLNKKDYFEYIIESADDSDKIEITRDLASKIKENYERLGM